MTIDKQKLQKLLWSEVASWKADRAEWKQNTEALGEFLGEKTMEEVALELLAENERLNTENKQLILLECHGGTAVAAINLMAERDQLKAENEELRESNDKLTRRNGMLEQNVEVISDTHVLYTWLRKKCDQPSNDVVAVNMNIGHDWVPVHDLDRDLRTMIDQEQP